MTECAANEVMEYWSNGVMRIQRAARFGIISWTF